MILSEDTFSCWTRGALFKTHRGQVLQPSIIRPYGVTLDNTKLGTYIFYPVIKKYVGEKKGSRQR